MLISGGVGGGTVAFVSNLSKKNHSVMKCSRKDVLHGICETFGEGWNCAGEQVAEWKPHKNEKEEKKKALESAVLSRPEGTMC